MEDYVMDINCNARNQVIMIKRIHQDWRDD
jgi:hypothetical protein